MDIITYAMWRAMTPAGGGDQNKNVTVLHGHGSEAVPLPDGVTFPAAADITPDEQTTPDGPYVKVIVLYVDSLIADWATGDNIRERVACNMSSFTTSGGNIVFRRSNPFDVELVFAFSADGIALTEGSMSMSSIIINEDTDWMMLIVDTRQGAV